MSFGIRKLLLLILSYLKYSYYSLINPFTKPLSPQTNTKSLLIIKLDEIGDYILFRNLLKYFKSSGRFKDYKITLCGNVIWKSIFELLDKDTVDSSVWINKNVFSKNLFYRKKLFETVYKENYNTVINCSLSRNFFLDDVFVKKALTVEKIGYKTDLSTQFKWQKKISDRYYTKLIEINDEIFDFRRNKKFINSILKTDIEETLPVINNDWSKSENTLNENYAVFYIGGRTNYKIWKVDNFIQVAKYINEKYGLKIFLLGSQEDVDLSSEFEKRFNNQNVNNLTARTTLIDVIKILNQASIMIGNDSGLAHIAAALNTKLIVIANGTHLGRFFPYPEEAANVKAIYPYEIETHLKNINKVVEKYKYRSTLDINSVLPENVINEVDNFLG